MEKKKLLLVAVAVGIVLLIIIGIPLLMIAPRQRPASSFQSSLPAAERDWVTAAEPVGSQKIQPVSGVTETEPQSYNGGAQSFEVTFAEPVENPSVTTLTVPIPETAAVPNTPVVRASKPSTVKPAVQRTPVQAAAPVNPPVAKTPVAAKPAPVKSPAANSGKKFDNYWVQTGAFSTKIRAEGARESLASRGIASIIDNRDIDGKTWYRVRVGPYISETEANYWLALVKTIDGFSESQIRLTQAVQ
ncbi:MAG: SPOR domain-containing protein [Treponema sp.]|jgi:DedD protein|nr:SPOR domain-containing protein [Treponema sp.]